MKKIILLLLLSSLAIGCSEDSVTTSTVSDDSSSQQPPTDDTPGDGSGSPGNKVMLLKVDYETNVFEGGVELEFPEADTFTISYDYNAPSDFGDITLYYQETGQPLFMGSIIWMGTGFMAFPCFIDAPEQFNKGSVPLQMPAISTFEKVMYDEFAIYPDQINYQAIWNSIDDLQLVRNYRQSNPGAKINLFLYTPSVGIGNPEEWDWYVILKN
ncbi:hypothetical protein CHU92_01025 [Flavobacterium cyanobacteriorum]|uniref:Uncharacterized protein n=1 Tax=Flavobacterium cyanobacteriorum TaxID=2022802 RepID=A0A256A2T9_9FLAO|nr:hypothetical protein [Flavobacterium cyanobacteriorum]OYQ47455.1 hypothetical protein CHU92_01025 [Flavobacterium cyanobacteriorum]